MSKKICLVTGANSGLGKEIAIDLAKQGAHVILVCRDSKKGQAALQDIKESSHSDSVDLLIADLSSQNDIRQLAKTIYQRYPTLHVLINNAGVVLIEKKYSVDHIEMTLATNYLGPFLLTQLLLDLLKASSPSRIINVSSAIHKWATINLNDLQFEQRKYHFMKAYAQSKLLMNIATFELAHQLQDTGVTVNCVHPGAVKTNLGSDSARTWFLKILDKLIKLFFISPSSAAKTVVYLATSPRVENISGKYFVKGKPVAAKQVKDALSKNVWEKSKQLVGLVKAVCRTSQ